MPKAFSSYADNDRRRWPVKVFRGQFGEGKKIQLEERYARRRIRLVFNPPEGTKKSRPGRRARLRARAA